MLVTRTGNESSHAAQGFTLCDKPGVYIPVLREDRERIKRIGKRTGKYNFAVVKDALDALEREAIAALPKASK